MTFETDLLFGLSKTLLTTFMTLLLMFVLTDFKYPKKTILAIFSAYFLYVGLSSWFLINLFGWMVFMRIFIFSISLPAVFIMYHAATDHAMQAVFNYATQIAVALILSVTGTVINTAVNGTRLSDLLIRFLLFLAALLLEYRYVRKLFRRVAETLKKEWTILAAIPVVFCLLFLLCGLYPVHFTENVWSTVHVYVAALVMVCVYIAVFRCLTDSCALLEAQRENDILETQVSALQKQADTLAEHTRQDAVYRNDVLCRAQYIYSLIKSGETDTALSYLDRMDQEFSMIKSVHYCDNPTLNDLFSVYLTHARRDGILVETNLDIPEQLPVDAIELSTVFANAIENARDSLNQLPVGTEKRLELRCVSSPRFVFEIANTCQAPVKFDEDGYPVREDNQRGVRTQSILAFAKKNDRVLVYDVSGGMFRLRLLIQDEKGD